MKTLGGVASVILAFLLLAPQGETVATDTAADREFDLQGLLDRELQAGKKRIVVPPGRYRVTPRQRQHLVLRGLEEVEIVAEGVEMICTETTRALTVENCRNVTVRGLVVDYDPLPFTQGRIVKLSEDKQVHEIELFDGYPAADTVLAAKYEIFRPDTRTLRCPDYYGYRVETITPRRIRLIKSRGNASDPEQVGDIVVINSETAPHGSFPHAVVCSNSKNVRLDSITVWASNCFGFYESGCDGTTYYRCKIDRRPLAEDLARRADPRIRSLDADAYHSKHAVKGPAYIECRARFMGDDCVNICGDYHMVTASAGSELRVLAKKQMNIEAGDPVELFAYDGRRLPDAKAVKIEQDGTIQDAERAFLRKQQMHEPFRTNRDGMLSQAFKITLDRAVELPMGSLIASARRNGNGFLVQGCDFGYNRSRGILIKASDGQIIGNTLTGNRMYAIVVSPEYWWLESGSASNVVIRGNTIRDCPTVGIAVLAHGGAGLAPGGAHQNIVITDNTIANGPLPGILVTSTEGLRVENNRVTAASDLTPPARLFASLKLDPGKAEPVMTVNCESPVLRNNRSR